MKTEFVDRQRNAASRPPDWRLRSWRGLFPVSAGASWTPPGHPAGHPAPRAGPGGAAPRRCKSVGLRRSGGDFGFRRRRHCPPVPGRREFDRGFSWGVLRIFDNAGSMWLGRPQACPWHDGPAPPAGRVAQRRYHRPSDWEPSGSAVSCWPACRSSLARLSPSLDDARVSLSPAG